MTFAIDLATAALGERKTISLGSQPVVLSVFRARSTQHVFAACDRPTVVHSSNGKLLFSNVNRKDVNFVCPFHCQDFPDHLALSTEEALTIGTVDDIQKLHVRTVHLHEQPRRICHQPQNRLFGVLTVLRGDAPLDEGDFEETYYLRVYDDQTFEVLGSVEMDRYETACSILSTNFGDDRAYFAVGTAYSPPHESEPKTGRIQVFEFASRQLTKVAEKSTKGAVFNMSDFNGKLLVGVNSTNLFAIDILYIFAAVIVIVRSR